MAKETPRVTRTVRPLEDVVCRIRTTLYNYVRFSRARWLLYPLLRTRVGEASLAHSLWRFLGFVPGDELVVRTGFGADLVIPSGYREAEAYISGFEPEVTALVARLLDTGMTFVDVGAHIGYYTLLARFKVGNTGRVFAFEPDPFYFEFLQRNLEPNCITEGVDLCQLAVTDQEGVRTFFPDRSGGRGNLYKSPHLHGKSIAVETISLDSFFGRLNWPKVNLIKIDVEGAELEVLRGMTRMVQMQRNLRVIMEFAVYRPAGWDPMALFATLKALNVKAYYVIENPGLGNDRAIIQYAERRGHVNLFCEW